MSGAAVDFRLLNWAKVIIKQAAFGLNYEVEAFGTVLLYQYCPVGVVPVSSSISFCRFSAKDS